MLQGEIFIKYYLWKIEKYHFFETNVNSKVSVSSNDKQMNLSIKQIIGTKNFFKI